MGKGSIWKIPLGGLIMDPAKDNMVKFNAEL